MPGLSVGKILCAHESRRKYIFVLVAVRGKCCDAGALDSSRSAAARKAACAGAVTGAFSQERNTSSHVPMTVEVLNASFFSKTGLRKMVPTATLHSVTPKHLLMATTTDQVRRPTSGTQRFLAYSSASITSLRFRRDCIRACRRRL